VRVARRKIEVLDWPGVRFRRHRTARSVVSEFLYGRMTRPLQVGGGWGRVTGEQMVARATRMRHWGFCTHDRSGKTVAVVHWWASPGASREDVFLMLFHECLHGVLTAKGGEAHRQMERFESVARHAFRAWRRAKR